MAGKDASTPRVFLMRHGETEWSLLGRYTGTTDLPLLPEGEARIRATARHIYGPGKLIDPDKLDHVFVSPRQRARRTFGLLFEEHTGHVDHKIFIEICFELAEWDYGEYEGKLTNEIRTMRKSAGLDQEREWDIWRDGCDANGGESVEAVTNRVDGLIGRIVEIQKAAMGEHRQGDVLVVAHGHILRAFVKRWLKVPLEFEGLSLMLEPAGIGGLSYQHNNVEERALLVGMSIP